METIFITHPSFYQHEMGAEHPESPLRLEAIQQHLERTGLANKLQMMTALKAKEEDLSRVHSLHHIAKIRQYAPETGYYSIDGDTLLNPHTLEAAYYAAGAGVLAVDEVMSGRAQRAFCAVRPPGHHACFDQAMGFCFFNNVAVAAAYAIEKYALDQVVIMILMCTTVMALKIFLHTKTKCKCLVFTSILFTPMRVIYRLQRICTMRRCQQGLALP